MDVHPWRSSVVTLPPGVPEHTATLDVSPGLVLGSVSVMRRWSVWLGLRASMVARGSAVPTTVLTGMVARALMVIAVVVPPHA